MANSSSTVHKQCEEEKRLILLKFEKDMRNHTHAYDELKQILKREYEKKRDNINKMRDKTKKDLLLKECDEQYKKDLELNDYEFRHTSDITKNMYNAHIRICERKYFGVCESDKNTANIDPNISRIDPNIAKTIKDIVDINIKQSQAIITLSTEITSCMTELHTNQNKVILAMTTEICDLKKEIASLRKAIQSNDVSGCEFVVVP